MIPELRLGIYRHYKGGLYQVLGRANDENADDIVNNTTYVEPGGPRIVVVYMPLQLDPKHLGPRMSVRTEEDFLGWVDEGPVRRFSYLGSELTAEMLGR